MQYLAGLPQGGLDVPCELKFEENLVCVEKIKMLISIAPPPQPQTNDAKSNELEPRNRRRKVN